MISKYSKRMSGSGKQEQAMPTRAKPKIERTRRLFTYRGVSFIATKEGNRAHVQIWDEDKKVATPGVDVHKDKIAAAAQALAKIVLAERELEEIVSAKERSSQDSDRP